jgi:hypothetical protein
MIWEIVSVLQFGIVSTFILVDQRLIGLALTVAMTISPVPAKDVGALSKSIS